MNADLLFIPTRTPAGKEMLVLLAGLLTCPFLRAFPGEFPVAWWRKKRIWDLQQQVLLRIHTVFQIIPWGANPSRNQ